MMPKNWKKNEWNHLCFVFPLQEYFFSLWGNLINRRSKVIVVVNVAIVAIVVVIVIVIAVDI